MSKICYIMGKSSSGKDTIFKRLKERRPEFRTITLYTTRPIREGETDGVEYHFTDESGHIIPSAESGNILRRTTGRLTWRKKIIL